MTKMYEVKAIGNGLYREKKFATANEADRYYKNLRNWVRANKPNTHYTVWVDRENNRYDVFKF